MNAVARTISATQLKARCLALLDDVAETGEPLVVTKRGKPVARVEPLGPPESLEGSVTFLVSAAPLELGRRDARPRPKARRLVT